MYFPRQADSGETGKETDRNVAVDLGGDETILVVDDEPALWELATEILTNYGYQVFSAADAKQALQTLATRRFALMISDVIMPETDGFQLAKRVGEQFPDFKILLASGFTDSAEGFNNADWEILPKPYVSHDLLRHVRAKLNEP